MSQSARPLVSVFVSSTFRDMHAERDYLLTVVFPEFRERLSGLGIGLRDVDLRWGVPDRAGDGERANPWAYCKRWIERAEPFFVGLLGHRYGSSPTPSELADAGDLAELAGLSVTELEIRHAARNPALPRHCFFYLRDTIVPETDPLRGTYVQEDRWGELVRLREEVDASGQSARHYEAKWTGSGFGGLDEFGRRVLEDLWSAVLRDERYVAREVWDEALGASPETDRLREDDSEALAEETWRRLVAVARPEPEDRLTRTTRDLERHAATLLRWFTGREKELAELGEFLRKGEVCHVEGAPGIGKSALLAAFCQGLAEAGDEVAGFEPAVKREPAQEPHALAIPHFVGATADYTDLAGVFERFLDELTGRGVEVPEDFESAENAAEDATRRFVSLLASYSGERLLVLVLDGWDHLEVAHTLDWLPERFSPGVRLIISQAEAPRVNSLGRPIRGTRVKVGALSGSEVRAVVTSYLAEYCKELDEEKLRKLCALPQVGNPRYLLTLMDECRLLSGDDLRAELGRILGDLPRLWPDTPALFGWVLEHRAPLGEEALALWCQLLGVSHRGLSPGELADLLERRLGPEGRTLAHRLERGLRDHMSYRSGGLVTWANEEIGAAATQAYADPGREEELRRDLADYFREHGSLDRQIDEVPFQLLQIQALDELPPILANLALVRQARAESRSMELTRYWMAVPNADRLVVGALETGLAAALEQAAGTAERSQLCADAGWMAHSVAGVQRAEPFYERALALCEEDPDTPASLRADRLRDLGTSLVWTRPETALERLREAREIYARLGDHAAECGVIDGMAMAYRTDGQYDEAVKLLRSLLEEFGDELTSRRAALLSNLAHLYKDAGRHREALDLYRTSEKIKRAVEGPLSASLATTLTNLGVLYAENFNFREAVALFTEAYEIRRTIVGEGHPATQKSKREVEVAERDWRHARARGIVPRLAGRTGDSGCSPAMVGRLAALLVAAVILTLAIGYYKLPRKWLPAQTAAGYAASGKYDEAAASLTEAIARTPDDPKLYVSRGTLYRTMPTPDLEAAVKDFRSAAKLRPRDFQYGLALYAVLIEAGKYDEALAECDALEAIAEGKQGKADVASLRGNVYLTANQPEQAIRWFDYALGLRPDWPVYQSNRGVAWAKLGDFERAKADCDVAVKAMPFEGGMYRARGLVSYLRGDDASAQADFKKCLDLTVGGQRKEMERSIATSCRRNDALRRKLSGTRSSATERSR